MLAQAAWAQKRQGLGFSAFMPTLEEEAVGQEVCCQWASASAGIQGAATACSDEDTLAATPVQSYLMAHKNHSEVAPQPLQLDELGYCSGINIPLPVYYE